MTEREKDIIEFVRFLDSLGIVKKYFNLLGGSSVPHCKQGFVSDAFLWPDGELSYWGDVDIFWNKRLNNG